MIGYIKLGTNDLPRAARFYDELLALLGAKRAMEFDRGIAWAVAPNQPTFGVTTPYDKQPAARGNGTMIALVARSREQLGQVWRKALEFGAAAEGASGPRGEGFYTGHFRDLDGNKPNVVFAG
jgi:catechol 2,3-dioxygenase-like lactoylglutathione lyase family enzyme